MPFLKRGGGVAQILLYVGKLLLCFTDFFRFLDIYIGNYSQSDRETRPTLTFVFEYMNMDLGQYINRCPPPGLPQSTVKERKLFYGRLCSVPDQ